MTNAELIAKINAEIEKLKATNPSEYNYQNAEGYVWALDDILSFLSTLETEKPIDLDGEIESYADYCEFDFKSWDYATLDAVARHFYELGKNEK